MILVTGGAGYIGSHVVLALQAQGEFTVVLDNLTTGDKRAVLSDAFVEGDVGDAVCLEQLFQTYEIDAVMHLAASTSVPESVANPLLYYKNNVAATLTLLDACCKFSVPHFIFSSSAAVYGIPDTDVVTESSLCQPINPYGTSKLMGELMLKDISAATALQHVSLRYFNVAGADPKGRVGSYKTNATTLVQRALQVALDDSDVLTIFGADYPTKDGTGVRDYIHVSDIAAAHVSALNYLRQSGESRILNCGYGHGYSVLDIVRAVEAVTGKSLAVKTSERRAGDPPMVIADNQAIQASLEWQPHYDDLNAMIKHGWDWEQQRER